jgi:hypothetical protein
LWNSLQGVDVSTFGPRHWCGVSVIGLFLSLLCNGCAVSTLSTGASSHASNEPAAAAKTHRETPLVVSSVTNQASSSPTPAQLRETLFDVLDEASFDGLPLGKRYLVTATLVELARSSTGDAAVTTSTMEVAVAEAGSGKIVGVVKGHGRVEASPDDSSADGDAVKAAMTSAVTSAVQMTRVASR